MSKPKPIQINIPDPCSQNWDEMTPSGTGRFCDHCMKTVIDFTTYSDTALYNFFSKNTGHVCGRFLSTQVDRTIAIPYQPHSRLYKITIAMGLTLLFTQTPHLLAQNRPPKVLVHATKPDSDTLPTYHEAPKLITGGANDIVSTGAGLYQNQSALASGEIKGQILDDKKEPLISAVIQVFQNGVLKGGNVSDYDGYYNIKQLDPGSYDLLILYVGYDSIKATGIIVTNDAATQQNFQFSSKNRRVLGGSTVIRFSKPLIDQDNPTKKVFTREEINNMPH